MNRAYAVGSLLRASDCQGLSFSATSVDYDVVIPFKYGLLDTVWRNFSSGVRPDLQPAFAQFCHEQAHWLDDYALFCALKVRYNNAHYLEWPVELVQRQPAALERARRDLARQSDQVRLAQFLLLRQGERLKAHALARGVRLIGDLPFFVSPDSSEPGAVPARQPVPATLRRRCAARLLQRPGTALGQPHV